MSEALGRLDQLIADLESTMKEADFGRMMIAAGASPRPATFVMTESSIGASLAQTKKTYTCIVTELTAEKVVYRAQTDISRSVPVQITFLVRKNAQGEYLAVVDAGTAQTAKVAGGYEFIAPVKEIGRKSIPAHRRFLEFVADNDAAGWNRWCADLEDGPVLARLDLSDSDLTDFDLACANLAESNLRGAKLVRTNLSGAKLGGCNLEGALVQGTDFFRAVLPRASMGLLAASGLVEVESVLWVD